jgi:hypothetical protein
MFKFVDFEKVAFTEKAKECKMFICFVAAKIKGMA